MRFEKDKVVIIETNIDDMSPQFFEPVEEALFRAGALDVFIEHIQMKKNRPAFKLSCIAPVKLTEKMASIMLEGTTSSGIRYYEVGRYKLPRSVKRIKTKYGPVYAKSFTLPSGKERCVSEYAELKKLAMKKGKTILEIEQAVRKAL